MGTVVIFCELYQSIIKTLKIVFQIMDFYSSTENDPLQKFLFPNETEALRGNNLLMMVGWGEGRVI